MNTVLISLSGLACYEKRNFTISVGWAYIITQDQDYPEQLNLTCILSSISARSLVTWNNASITRLDCRPAGIECQKHFCRSTRTFVARVRSVVPMDNTIIMSTSDSFNLVRYSYQVTCFGTLGQISLTIFDPTIQANTGVNEKNNLQIMAATWNRWMIPSL